MVNLRPIGKAIKGEVPQVVRIARRNVDQKIVAAGNVKDTSHLGELDHVLAEGVDQIPRVLAQTHRDHRFETNADR